MKKTELTAIASIAGRWGICIAAALSTSGMVHAEDLSAQYVRENGVLYRIEATGKFQVDETVVSVRFADGITSYAEFIQRLDDAGVATRTFESLRVERVNRLGIHDLRLRRGMNVLEVRDAFQATGLVRWAEETTIGVYGGDGWEPGDPLYDDVYALNNTGQTGGTADADMDVLEAWALQRGNPSVIIAVLDSGTESTHEDLAINIWQNLDEIAANGVDDDGNGYVDDFEGWDFNNNNNQVAGPFYHGTHVAGCVAAKSNNATGVASPAGGWGLFPGCKVMALGVGDFSPNGGILDDAILYAADNGARVITLSLSVGESNAINDAIAEVYDNMNVFVDCAAGNGGSQVSYPARLERVVAVGATDHNDNAAGFSNPGPQVEVSAPGVDVMSTQLNNGYGESSGTSFAAPYVAAVAGLIIAEAECVTNEDIRAILIASAEDVHSSGFDTKTGWGRINAFDALVETQNSYACTLDCQGDINGDETVDVDDLLAMLSLWGTDDVEADLDGSGTVDVNDLLGLLAVWGTCTTS